MGKDKHTMNHLSECPSKGLKMVHMPSHSVFSSNRNKQHWMPFLSNEINARTEQNGVILFSLSCSMLHSLLIYWLLRERI